MLYQANEMKMNLTFFSVPMGLSISYQIQIATMRYDVLNQVIHSLIPTKININIVSEFRLQAGIRGHI
jgi:hypothetical protein